MPRPPRVSSWANPTPPHPRHGDEIAVAGEFLHTHVSNRVIQWFDPGGFDAYDPNPPLPADVAPGASPALAAERGGDLVPVPRHGTRRIGGPNGELVTSAADLERALTQLVVHYDGCGRSRDCFRALHDERGLSCHFLIDADGRVYQTLDVIERAWHATSANDASVGVELAHEGAFVEGEAPFDENAPAVVRGDVNGKSLAQRPFTDAQYESLARLAATLIARFPLMTNEHPRKTRKTETLSFNQPRRRIPALLILRRESSRTLSSAATGASSDTITCRATNRIPDRRSIGNGSDGGRRRCWTARGRRSDRSERRRASRIFAICSTARRRTPRFGITRRRASRRERARRRSPRRPSPRRNETPSLRRRSARGDSERPRAERARPCNER